MTSLSVTGVSNFSALTLACWSRFSQTDLDTVGALPCLLRFGTIAAPLFEATSYMGFSTISSGTCNLVHHMAGTVTTPSSFGSGSADFNGTGNFYRIDDWNFTFFSVDYAPHPYEWDHYTNGENSKGTEGNSAFPALATGGTVGVPSWAAFEAAIAPPSFTSAVNYGLYMLWLGQRIPYSEANYAKFVTVTNGIATPADNGQAAADAFGTPSIWLVPPAATFKTNLGTLGALTLAGTDPTNFAPRPSYEDL